jgi:putative membrane protein
MARTILTRSEASAIEARTAEVEARTGVEVVAAVVAKSYAYPQLPWKAFALGTAAAGCALVLIDALRPDWITAHAALLHTVAILGTGAACAIVAVFVPPFAKLFLRAPRRDLEVRRYAESLFVRRGLINTRERNGILLLVSLFERKVELLPDIAFHSRVSAAEWHAIVTRMMPKLRTRRASEAVLEGLDGLDALLVAKGFGPHTGGRNELPNRPIVEPGS